MLLFRRPWRLCTARLAQAPLLLSSALSLSAQYTIAPTKPDTCLLPSDCHLTWISDATEAKVGEVYYPACNAHVNAYLAGNTEEWIRNALEGPCTQTQVATDTIAICIKHLRVAEAGANDKVRSSVFLELDVLHRSAAAWRVCFAAQADVQELLSATDTTRQARNINKALAQCLRAYRVARDGGKLIDKAYEIGSTGVGALRYPILAMPTLPKGVFRTAEAFRNADIEPVPDGVIGFDRRKRAVLLGEIAKQKDGIWALCDGTNLYINLDGEFLPLDYTGTHFTTTIRRRAEAPSRRVAIGMTFGAMGTMVTLPQMEYVQARLDLETGMLVPYGEEIASPRATHIIKLSKFTDERTRLGVIYGDKGADLERDTYCELEFPVGGGAELVRVQASGKELRVVLDNGSPGRHVHLIDVKDSDVPTEKHLTEDMEREMLDHLSEGSKRLMKTAE